MKLLALLTTAGLAAAAGLTRCGTADPDDNLKTQLNEAYFSRPSYSKIATAENSRVIDTYIHVVTTQAKRSKYTKDMINEQMNIMNSAYNSFGVTFNTVSIDFTINADWAAAMMSSAEEYDMKASLHKGNYSDLNLYFTSDLPNAVLGFCYFPVAAPTSDDLILDGCMCLADSLPNGTAEHYNQGLTAVHETGHWFGLYHVFQGKSCSGSGDSVQDTPVQKVATEGCPKVQDSCPGKLGNDSIHNFMDYSYDECMTEFSEGQTERATAIYDQQRAGK